jgi:hypothetical protein
MDKLVTFSLTDLIREIEASEELINKATIPNEIAVYKDWLLRSLADLKSELNKIKYYLRLGIQDDDITLATTTDLIRFRNIFRILNTTYIPLLIRIIPDDYLTLKFINWLHQEHKQTLNHPFIITNGDFGIYPSKDSPIRYHLPVASQISLLHFPLIFHEFGHLLFIKHKEEMVDIIKAFQKKLNEIIDLPIQKYENKNQPELLKRTLIIETWYEWLEELFCDAVGLNIGGNAYLNAFSHFIRFSGSSTYFVPEKDLAKRSHPVSWLRVRLLSERAIRFGLNNESRELLNDWQKIADVLKIKEEYFGYYSKDFHSEIVSSLNDMLTEAEPIQFQNYLHIKTFPNFINLLIESWERFQKEPEKYPSLEREIIRKILETI